MLQIGSRLDFREESLGPDRNGELRLLDFYSNLAVVLQVLGEVDSGHASCAELAVDAISVSKGCGQTLERFAHRTKCGANWLPPLALSTSRGAFIVKLRVM